MYIRSLTAFNDGEPGLEQNDYYYPIISPRAIVIIIFIELQRYIQKI